MSTQEPVNNQLNIFKHFEAAEKMSLAQLTERLKQNMIDTYIANAIGVYTVKKKKLYKQEFSSVAQWAESEFGWSRQQVYNYTNAAEVYLAIDKGLENVNHGLQNIPLPTHERQLRPLAPLKQDPRLVAGIWTAAVEKYGDEVTGPEIEQEINTLRESGAVQMPATKKIKTPTSHEKAKAVNTPTAVEKTPPAKPQGGKQLDIEEAIVEVHAERAEFSLDQVAGMLELLNTNLVIEAVNPETFAEFLAEKLEDWGPVIGLFGKISGIQDKRKQGEAARDRIEAATARLDLDEWREAAPIIDHYSDIDIIALGAKTEKQIARALSEIAKHGVPIRMSSLLNPDFLNRRGGKITEADYQ